MNIVVGETETYIILYFNVKIIYVEVIFMGYYRNNTNNMSFTLFIIMFQKILKYVNENKTVKILIKL